VTSRGSPTDRAGLICFPNATIRLTMANRSNVLRASRSMRGTVTTPPGARASSREEFAAVAVRARHLLAVNLRTARAAQLLKLGFERLPVAADAGVAEGAVLRFSSGHILCKP
jgi:hypothetical protein